MLRSPFEAFYFLFSAQMLYIIIVLQLKAHMFTLETKCVWVCVRVLAPFFLI